MSIFKSSGEKLLDAIKKRNYQQVKSLIPNVGNLNYSMGGFDDSPLKLASSLGYTEIIDLLIKNGAQDQQSLALAAENDHTSTVRLLLSYNPTEYTFLDFNNDWSGFLHSSLFAAAEKGYTEIINLLVDRIRDTQYDQTEIKRRNRYIINALTKALAAEHNEIVNLLETLILEYETVENIIINAIKYSNYKVIQRFINRNQFTQNQYYLFLREGACSSGHITLIRFLLERIDSPEPNNILNDALRCVYNRLNLDAFEMIIQYIFDAAFLDELLIHTTQTLEDIQLEIIDIRGEIENIEDREYQERLLFELRNTERSQTLNERILALLSARLENIGYQRAGINPLFSKLRSKRGSNRCNRPINLEKTSINKYTSCFDNTSTEEYKLIDFLNGVDAQPDPDNPQTPEQIEQEKNDRIVFFTGTQTNLIPNCYKKSYLNQIANSHFYGTSSDSIVMLPFPRIYIYVRDLLEALETDKRVFVLLPCTDPSVIRLDGENRPIHNIYVCEGRADNPMYPIEFQQAVKRRTIS